MKNEVIEHTELLWSFDSDKPYLLAGNLDKSRRYVDPHPCYAHNHTEVENCLYRVTSRFPIGVPTIVDNFHYETLDRCNGETSADYDWNDKIPRKPYPHITLKGKRIPPHPAMTRYLVSHEYGHAVEMWIAYKRGDKDIRAEYAKMRGVVSPISYSGRTWHLSVGEVFANDFRILICQDETEFWPHEVVHPLFSNEARQWWNDAQKYMYREGE